MNLLNLFIGIILVILSVLYFLHVLRRENKDKDYDSISYLFDLNIVVGIIAFFAVGIVLIYRELRHLF